MHKRKVASNIILLLFFVLVALAAAFSHLFQAPVKSASLIEQTKLFSANDLGLIKKISLKNKSGEYIFERNELTPASTWHMVAPREVASTSLFIEKLFLALTTVKVKKLYPDEKINNSNFSIDKPTANLNLIDSAGNAVSIKVGLMNTIDNSTYLKVTGKNGIYHVEAPSASLENVTIIDLIESQIIPISLDTVSSYKIFHNKKDLLEIINKEGVWQDNLGNALAVEKISDYFNELSSLKSTFILDKQTENQKKQLGILARNAQFSIFLSDKQNNKIEYSISAMTKTISDLDLKNEEYFVISVSNSSTAYVVKKEYFELFNRKPESLREALGKN